MRQEHFDKLKNHAHYARLISKLKTEEIDLINAFINTYKNYDRNLFTHTVNRMFLDRDKTKHWSLIMEILTVIA